MSQEFPKLSQRKLCAMLELNRSTLWKQAAKPVEQKKGSKTQPQDLCEVIELRPALDDEALVVEKMRAVVLAHPTWGYRRVWAWLRHQDGLVINKKRIERLMRENRWQVRNRSHTPRPRVEQSVSKCEEPGQRWAIDMTSTYCTQDGWVGITAVIDCHDREIVGLHVSKRGRAQDAEQALEEACLLRYGLVFPQGETRPMLRSDNGKVFTSKHFTACCKQYGLSQEFIRPYTPQQNGMIERFFRSLKEECIWKYNFETFEEAKTTIQDWVKFYNDKRPHQALGYL